MQLRSMTIASRLLLMALAAVTLVITIGAFNLKQLGVVYSAASDTESVWMPRTVDLDQILFTMLRYHTTTIRKVIAVDPAEIKGLDDELTEMDASVPVSLGAYRNTIATEGERGLWTIYEAKWKAYLDARIPLLQALARGDRATAVAATAPARAPLVAAFDALSAVIKVNDAGAKASVTAASQAYGAAWQITVGLCLGGVLVMVAFAAWIVRSVSKPLTEMVHAMLAVVSGKLASRIPHSDRLDEIGQMARAAEAFRQASLTNRRLEEEADELRRRADAERGELQAEAEAAASERLREAMAGLAAGLNQLAKGNLTVEISRPFAAEFEPLRLDLNRTANELGVALAGVVKAAGSIDDGSREINQSTDDLSRRTEQQAANLEETAAALDQITATVKKSSDGALKVRRVVSATRQDAETSSTVVRQAVGAMSAIERSSREIGQIIGVIDEIAFQTNLLALNAGVEAARAGDAGRGFAVVASEVRTLAQRSAEAAKEIKALISASAGQVVQGVDLVGQVEAVLGKIVTQVGQIDASIVEIAASSQEQSVALDQVNTAINQMDQVTQQNAAMVEETTAAGHALQRETANLTSLVGRFKVADARQGIAPPHRPMPAVQRAGGAVVALKAVGRSGAAAKLDAQPHGSWAEF